jgi:DNA-binding response OmpR family regulator
VTKVQLLLVDDEPSIATGLAAYLTSEGFAVETAASLAAAQAAVARGGPALVLLDWNLPDGAGSDLLRAWRAAGVTLPVILLTARGELIDKVVGLELGANDYVTKPFAPRELLARIKVQLRQAAPTGAAVVAPRDERALGRVRLDLDARRAFDGETEVVVTRLEFDLLRSLVESVGKVMTRDELLNRVWGYDAFPTTRTVDTHVLQLRQKFPSLVLETVRGVGYRLVAGTGADAGRGGASGRGDEDLARR